MRLRARRRSRLRGPLLLLTLGKMLEELRGAPPAFGGESDDIIQVGGGVAQAEGGELISEWNHQVSSSSGAGGVSKAS